MGSKGLPAGHAETVATTSEEGFTLIEVIITVALISIAFVGILSAVGGLVLSGAQNKSAAQVQATVRNVAAFTQSFDSAPYKLCGATAPTPAESYQSAITSGAAVPSGFTATITGVQFWNGDTPATFAGACPGAGDQGLELVTVNVSSSGAQIGGAFSKSLTVLKRSTP